MDLDPQNSRERLPDDKPVEGSADSRERSGPDRAAKTTVKTSSGRQNPGGRVNFGMSGDEEAAPVKKHPISRLLQVMRRTLVSSLTRRIIFLNLTALAVILSSILYLNQFREGLIDARVESLLTQGRIIADSISVSATVETNTITIDPEKLLELRTGESVLPTLDNFDSLDFPIDPERIAPVLRELIQPTRTRARIYDPEGLLILDSRHLYAGGQVLRYNLPLLDDEEMGMLDFVRETLNWLLRPKDLPIYREIQGLGTEYPEVASALLGAPKPVVRVTEKGEMIVSVALPIQRFRAVLGVLLLSTQGGDIDRIVTEERLAILRIFLVAAIVMVILSIVLSSAIATPLRKLSESANRVRRGVNSRVEIPNFSGRQDEIGDLSAALGEMTNSLYGRIDAIESFAADVSHELKNPLTSLRSAVETMPLAKTQASKDRLMAIIQHDVRRLDRLITDISDASRLDAELARTDLEPIDLEKLLLTVVEIAGQISKQQKQVEISTVIEGLQNKKDGCVIQGHDSRLGQVINNLIDNAKSFVPESGGKISVSLKAVADNFQIIVEDNGPGIQAEDMSRVFERFYTDRPDGEAFGQNSGLGLSISKQIIEAHGGSIKVENRRAPANGARFIILLPAGKSE
ncbi:MAG: sensor histidine kinase [Rhizobiaceae bacterium]